VALHAVQAAETHCVTCGWGNCLTGHQAQVLSRCCCQKPGRCATPRCVSPCQSWQLLV
jgi:hypothetical protein